MVAVAAPLKTSDDDTLRFGTGGAQAGVDGKDVGDTQVGAEATATGASISPGTKLSVTERLRRLREGMKSGAAAPAQNVKRTTVQAADVVVLQVSKRARTKLDFGLEERKNGERGRHEVFVRALRRAPGGAPGAAEVSGMRVGDVVLRVGDVSVLGMTLKQLVRVLADTGDTVAIQVRRQSPV